MGAIEETNAKGGIDGKWMIELITKDDGSDVAKASAAVTQLIQQDKVDFILQPWVDFIAPVARGIEEKAGMPGVLSYHPAKGDTGDVQVDVQQRAGRRGQRRRAGQDLRGAGLEDRRRRR